MFIVAIIGALGVLLGIAFVIKEVHEITDEPVFPLIGVVVGIFGLVMLLKAAKG